LIAAAIWLGSAAFAMAEGERCYVTDPTGTPLNVRASPNGAIIGTLKNGKFVLIVERANAANGKPWALVVDFETKQRIGWVFYRYLSCS
jgi:hypothetical protein